MAKNNVANPPDPPDPPEDEGQETEEPQGRTFGPGEEIDLSSLPYKVELMVLDPYKAQQLIDGSKYNRKVSKKVVAKYAREMRAGKWHFNGQPFIMNGTMLLNGAHRCAAVVASLVSIPIVMVTGVEETAIRTMDTGKARTFDQMLAIDEEAAPRQLASLIAYLCSYRSTDGASFAQLGFSTVDKYDRLEAEPDTRLIAPFYARRTALKVPAGLLACCDYLFQQKDQQQAKQFMLAVLAGEDLQAGDPAYAFREYVLKLDPERPVGLVAQIGYALVFCWNAHRQGNQITKLRAPKRCPEIL